MSVKAKLQEERTQMLYVTIEPSELRKIADLIEGKPGVIHQDAKIVLESNMVNEIGICFLGAGTKTT